MIICGFITVGDPVHIPHSLCAAVIVKTLILDALMLAGGFLIIDPSLRRAVPSALFDKCDLFSCRFATCH